MTQSIALTLLPFVTLSAIMLAAYADLQRTRAEIRSEDRAARRYR